MKMKKEIIRNQSAQMANVPRQQPGSNPGLYFDANSQIRQFVGVCFFSEVGKRSELGRVGGSSV